MSINNTRYIGARRPYKVVATVLDEVYGNPSERIEIDFTSTDDLTINLTEQQQEGRGEYETY